MDLGCDLSWVATSRLWGCIAECISLEEVAKALLQRAHATLHPPAVYNEEPNSSEHHLKMSRGFFPLPFSFSNKCSLCVCVCARMDVCASFLSEKPCKIKSAELEIASNY